MAPSSPNASHRHANSIMRKWRERTADREGFFLRHLDGDLSNEDPSNLQRVHPFDTFSALVEGEKHADDWTVGLTDAEVLFVRDHADNFRMGYETNGRREEVPLNSDAVTDHEAAAYQQYLDQAMENAMQDPEVVRLSAEGDAAMEAGDFDRAVELLEAAKLARDQLLPITVGPGEMIMGGEAVDLSSPRTSSAVSSSLTSMSDEFAHLAVDQKSKPLHGRRSVQSSGQLSPQRSDSIISSTPSRRRQPEGAPTRREEVAARIAARNTGGGR